MSLLVETIKSENGKLQNTGFHNERLIRSLYKVFGIKSDIDLENVINVPETLNAGIFKCRVEYDEKIRKIEFQPYSIKPVLSLKIVEDDAIDYRYKFVDRTDIKKLFGKRSNCDDIIIVKNGFITDSSYANLIFKDKSGKWATPESCLLAGTRRASLLQLGLIYETVLTYSDLGKYTEVKLINAMIGIDDTKGIPVANIF
jgi:4-amino-4-deoxychorismate lyase